MEVLISGASVHAFAGWCIIGTDLAERKARFSLSCWQPAVIGIYSEFDLPLLLAFFGVPLATFSKQLKRGHFEFVALKRSGTPSSAAPAYCHPDFSEDGLQGATHSYIGSERFAG
jgi:hypothetical protein